MRRRTPSSGFPGRSTTTRAGSCGRPTCLRSGPTCCPPTGLTEHLGLPVSIANDADLAAVGEAWFGAGAASHAVGYLTISTGIGAGVVHGGRLLRGPRSLAEVGHVVIDWRAWVDGAPSTLEELGSGSGVARLAREAGLGSLGAREVQAGAAAGEPRAVAIWQQAIAACAAGVSNLVMSFYPSTVVIGGGMGRQDEFFGPLRDDGAAATGSPPRRPHDRPLHAR